VEFHRLFRGRVCGLCVVNYFDNHSLTRLNIMSDAFWAEFFGNLPTLLAAVGALIVALRTNKESQAIRKEAQASRLKTRDEIESVKTLVHKGMGEMTAMARGMSERVMARSESSESTDDDPM
jgi:hypothetical protein